jgi:hypothetical protein
MKKSLSLVAAVAFTVIGIFFECNFTAEHKTLAEIPPIIIIVPTGNLSDINTGQIIIKTNLPELMQQENMI